MNSEDVVQRDCSTERKDMKREYEIYFRRFFKNLKERSREFSSSKHIEGLSSGELAFINTIDSLPCPVNIVRIKVDTRRYKESGNDIYHLIKYDFARAGEFFLSYYGEICMDEIENYALVLEVFGLSQSLIRNLRTFKLEGYGDPDQWDWVSVLAYDVLERPEEYIEDFLFMLETIFWHKIVQELEEIDFNAKYGLKTDPILSSSELLKKDKIFSSFVRMDEYGKHQTTLEDLQKNICNIQLIPQVPEEVKRVFNAAKRLYLFGYFEYYFFTISQHYGFLALESALRNRYHEICGGSRKSINLPEVIKELTKRGFIPKGEENIYDAGRCLRNALSHLAKPTIMTPNSYILKRIAYQINQIYDRETDSSNVRK